VPSKEELEKMPGRLLMRAAKAE